MAKFVAVPVWVCCMLSCLYTASGRAQTLQDTLPLGEVEIFADRFAGGTAGVDVVRYNADHAPGTALQSVADFLQMQSAAVLRGYGPGSSYSASIQGGSASQMQVLLNGIPFENPSLAQADLSLLPGFLFSDIRLLNGPSAALLGNASVAGTLFLDRRPGGEQEPVLSQKLMAGSFGEFGSGTALNYGAGRLSANTSLYFREAQNDFERTRPGGIEEPQPNAFFRTRGLQQSVAYRSPSGWNTDALIWYNETDRRIPPVLSRADSRARQHDANLRAQVHADRRLGRIKLSADLAADRGALDFFDRGVDDQSAFTTWHAQAEAKTEVGRTDVSLLAFYRRATAASDNYGDENVRSSPAAVIRAQRSFFGGKTRISTALRGEWLNGRFLPPVPTVGIDQHLAEHWQVRGNVSRVYRLPGLNDLFWTPGGNPDLLPESGWSQELGIHHSRRFGESRLQASVSGFSRKVENWIIWQPGPSFWRPENLRSVWSRGVQLRASWAHSAAGLRFTRRAEADYVRSTNRDSQRGNDSSVGHQLIYVPMWSAMWEERIAYGKWGFAAVLQYRSERFTAADNSRSLDPYALVHLQADYAFAVRAVEVRANLTVRNLLDSEFTEVINRPMPGRHFMISLEVNLFGKGHASEEP